MLLRRFVGNQKAQHNEKSLGGGMQKLMIRLKRKDVFGKNGGEVAATKRRIWMLRELVYEAKTKKEQFANLLTRPVVIMHSGSQSSLTPKTKMAFI